MNVMMLGSSYGVPTVRMGTYGASLAGSGTITRYQIKSILPDGCEWLTDTSDNVYTDYSGKALYVDQNGMIFNELGQKPAPKESNPIAAAAEIALADLIKQAPSASIDILRAQLINKGFSPAVADATAKRHFNLTANLPWIILGGVGLVAILFMVGSRKRGERR